MTHQLHFHDLDPNVSGTRQPGKGVRASRPARDHVVDATPSCSSTSAAWSHAFLRVSFGGCPVGASALSREVGVADRSGNSVSIPRAAASAVQAGVAASRRIAAPTSRMALDRLRDSGIHGKQRQAALLLVQRFPGRNRTELEQVSWGIAECNCFPAEPYARRLAIGRRLSELGQPLPSRPRGLGVVQSYLRPGDRELRWVTA